MTTQSVLRGPAAARCSAIRYDWRAGAIVLTVLIAAQGCGVIADSRSRALSPREVLPAESRTDDHGGEKPQLPALESETLPLTNDPPPPTTGEDPPVEESREPEPATMTDTGLASWYGARHHGKVTASGEVFNQDRLTAAHRTLPWGTKVKVTNLDNGMSVHVRINDRGPFKKGRIIDVSRAAARALGMVKKGIAMVRIEWHSDSAKANEFAAQSK